MRARILLSPPDARRADPRRRREWDAVAAGAAARIGAGLPSPAPLDAFLADYGRWLASGGEPGFATHHRPGYVVALAPGASEEPDRLRAALGLPAGWHVQRIEPGEVLERPEPPMRWTVPAQPRHLTAIRRRIVSLAAQHTTDVEALSTLSVQLTAWLDHRPGATAASDETLQVEVTPPAGAVRELQVVIVDAAGSQQRTSLPTDR